MCLRATVVGRMRWPLRNLEPRSGCEVLDERSGGRLQRAGRWVLGAKCVVWSYRVFGLRIKDYVLSAKVVSGRCAVSVLWHTETSWQYKQRCEASLLPIRIHFPLIADSDVHVYPGVIQVPCRGSRNAPRQPRDYRCGRSVYSPVGTHKYHRDR